MVLCRERPLAGWFGVDCTQVKNPRHLFILLGFLAQGLTWDSYLFSICASILWLLAVTVLHRRVPVSLTSEALALLFGCIGSVAISKLGHGSMHFFLGDGLVLLQLVRLMRPLSNREKLTSTVIACFHFGVLCTLAPNIRFVVLFLAAILLFPGALKESFTEPDRWGDAPSLDPKRRIRRVPSMRVSLWLMLGSAFVFLTFPRFTGTPLQLREGFSDQGSLLDSILDPRRGGRANSQQVLLQIEGPNIRYLRCFALTEFDGVKWWKEEKVKLRVTPYLVTKEEVEHDKRYLGRKVFVKNSQYLGKIIPVDGWPVYMKQNFFTHPFSNILSGALECNAVWTTGNNIYEYYIEKEHRPEELDPATRRRLLYYPPQSTRLEKWLGEITSKGTNALQASRLLELHLRNHFTYQLGTPELSRLAPVDDLIFNRQEGHCERFAAAMALFLRMQGIPSRVVVGYVAGTRNLFSGRQQARFCDAHSWVEGYFENTGWVTFDATPGPPPGSGGSDFWDMIEDLDFAWYSHIVNFNGFAQRDLIANTLNVIKKVPRETLDGVGWLFLFFIGSGTTLKLAKDGRFRWKLRLRGKPAAAARARHYYEEMLQTLEKQGKPKEPRQTPLEFLEQLRTHSTPAYNDAALVTEAFCESFYGETALGEQREAETRAALERLKSECAHEKNHFVERS